MDHPLLKFPAFIFYTSVWIIFMAIDYFITSRVLDLNAQYLLIDAVLSWFVFMWLGLGFWYPARFISFDRLSFTGIVIQHLGAAIVSSILWTGLVYLSLVFFSPIDLAYKNFLDTSVGYRFLSGIFLYIIIVSLYYIYIYYKNYQIKQLKEAELKSLVKEAELKTLRYQINPHFIFNSLNSISSLTMIDPDKAREMTIKLSSFLRATLANNEKQLNKLSEELNNCRLYLEIEKIRFGDKFEYIEDLKGECTKIQVPNMILQPLFENAIKYGVYESLEKIIIRLSCSVQNEYLRMTLENNFDTEASSAKGEGIGLKNIRDRLRLFYNQDNLLTVDRKDGFFTVNIFIPLEEV